MRLGRLEPQTSISVVWGVNCSATHRTSCLSIPSAGTKERKIPYPTSNPLTQLFRFVSCPKYTYEVSLTKNIFLPDCLFLKFRGGGGVVGAPPLFLDQTQDQRVEKNFFETAPPLSQGLDDCPPLIWRSGPKLFIIIINLYLYTKSYHFTWSS